MKKISWQIDKNIYPEHFKALEKELFSGPLNIFKDLCLDITGFIDFKLNQDLLKNNILKFEKLSCITHDNKFIDISKNSIISNLDLNELLNNKKHKEEFYLGINFQTNKIEENFIEKYNDNISYEIYQLNLNVSDIKEFDIYLGKIKNNQIDFDSSYPFNKVTQDHYTQKLYYDIENLIYDIRKIDNAEANIFEYYFKQEAHVKIIFDKLYELYIKISTKYKYEDYLKYHHNNQKESFNTIISNIRETIELNANKYLKKYFKYQNGKFSLIDLNIEQLINKKVYLKFNNGYTSNNIKIASIARLDYINMHSLEGIKISHNDDNLELDFHYNKEELEYIKQDETLAFALDVDGVNQAYLYYQK